MLWNRGTDTLSCDVDLGVEMIEPFTRRKLLSVAQRVFDPIGFCCPVTLYPKLLLQESWKSKLGWDDELSTDVTEKFKKWFKDLHLLKVVEIPRYMSIDNCVSISLHTFCDASKLSFATVIFLRSESKDQVSVQLVLAKSRIAPLKTMSIPRLELMACTIGVRLTDTVKRALSIQDIEEYYWTDSTSVLYWITHEDTWTVFVKNRVKEIRKLSDQTKWRHVLGSENPSDLPSRGCSVHKLIESRWWEGPHWLKLPKEEWPHSTLIDDTEKADSERRKVVATALNNVKDFSSKVFSYFLTYKKNLRMMGWILRFLENSRKKREERQHGELKVRELEKAEKD
ncbi:uncharacterized protein LOC129224138 [Uloborus diversus]|uniref:uncharacterized protein LOC129224138 n=1 Tax=Uloborus diversus TaxID=327109 RepID=UPI002409CDBD|nr:uncharacterized protein LOC129224138 [Uloborus diversus]